MISIPFGLLSRMGFLFFIFLLFFLCLIFEFNVLPLLQNSPWFCQSSTTSPNYIFHSSHKKKTLISFIFYSFSVFASPLKFILIIFLLNNPFKIDSTIAFILYCLRSHSVCFFKGYCRIQYATMGSLKLVYFSFRLISAYILIFKLQALCFVTVYPIHPHFLISNVISLLISCIGIYGQAGLLKNIIAMGGKFSGLYKL